jgi:hypothetical protein
MDGTTYVRSQQERSSIWMGFCEPFDTPSTAVNKANQITYKMYQRKPVKSQNEQNEKDFELEYTKFNHQFQIRDDVNRMDLLLLSSVDLGYDTKKNRLRRTKDL